MYDILDLLNGLGGLLGLFLGYSVLSLLEYCRYRVNLLTKQQGLSFKFVCVDKAGHKMQTTGDL